MASSEISTYIEYRQPGTQPPIYVAGTFSDPPWEPCEMDYTVDDDGEYTFRKEVSGKPGSKIQYKFRIGSGDWWVLHDNVPTVQDSNGNVNQVLEIPPFSSHFDLSTSSKREYDGPSLEDTNGDQVSPRTVKPLDRESRLADKPQTPAKHLLDSQSGISTPTYARVAAEVADSATLLNKEKPETPVPDDVAGQIGYRRLSSTPIVEVANTAAEVADTARDLDEVEEVTGFGVIPVNDGPPGSNDFVDEDETSNDKTLLFSHECVGMYDDEMEARGDGGLEDVNREAKVSEGKIDEIDLDDPTLERFPSNREEIIDAVRRLETGLTEDEASFEGANISPVMGALSRRGTEDIVSDPLLSPVPVSPAVPRPAGRLSLPRSARTSVISTHSSVASLHAIDESDEPSSTEGSQASPVFLRITPQMRSPLQAPSSDEDEGVVLKERAETAKVEAFQQPTPEDTPSPKQDASPQPQHDKGVQPPDDHSSQHPSETIGNTSHADAQNGNPRIVIDASEDMTSAGQRADKNVDNGLDGLVTGTTATGVEGSTSSTHLRKRGRADEQTDNAASHSPLSRSPDYETGWLGAFFRLVFVDWIGGFISRFCGRRRKT